MDLTDFDDNWARLAIAIHECSAKAVESVLFRVISAKHVDLQSNSFEETFRQALVRDEAQIRKGLLTYEIPKVFPPGPCVCPAQYGSLDIGIVAKLVRYYAGHTVWQASTRNLPDIENLHNFNFATASDFALVALLKEFRNWAFHCSGSRPLAFESFSNLWDGLMNVLRGLGYDVARVSSLKAGPLGNGSKVHLTAIMKEWETFRRQAKEDKDAILKLQSEMALKAELKNVEKLESEIDALKQSRSENVCAGRAKEAKEACWSAHDSLLSARELDLFGDQVEGKRKIDLMVSLVAVKCSDADAERLNPSSDVEYHLGLDFTRFETVRTDSMFNEDNVVLVRGLPGSGKTTFCHFILREWQTGQLWKDRYDLMFYVNAPLLVSLLDVGPFTVEHAFKELYPDVFSKIAYEQLCELKYLVIIDSIDECDVGKISSAGSVSSAESVIRKLIVSPGEYDRIIVGRPHACDEVRGSLLKSSPFQFVEVVGFSTDQLRNYVGKFCNHDEKQADIVWNKINDNKSLFGMAHLPVFANVACNIVSECNAVQIKTQTELYVWAYFVFLTRHLKVHHPDVDVSTFEKFFQNDDLLEALKKVSEMAYNHLTTGKIFFKASEFQFSKIELTLISPFLVRRETFLCFAHLTMMEYLTAVHLLLSRFLFSSAIFENQHMRGVLPLYFGLLGASAVGSDSPKIICNFVEPLMKKFNLGSPGKHPLSSETSRSLFHMGVDLYISVFHEFQNPGFISGSEFYWDNVVQLSVTRHHQIDPLAFFVKNVVCSKRRVGSLAIYPTDERLSVSELEKLLDCLIVSGQNVDKLGLWWLTSVGANEMEVLALACACVSNVSLSSIKATSWKSWDVFLRALQIPKEFRRLHFGNLLIRDCIIDSAVVSELRQLGVDVV